MRLLLVINTNSLLILHHFQDMADYMSIFSSVRASLHLNAFAGGGPTPPGEAIPVNIAINDIPLKVDSSGYISLAECIGVSLTTF